MPPFHKVKTIYYSSTSTASLQLTVSCCFQSKCCFSRISYNSGVLACIRLDLGISKTHQCIWFSTTKIENTFGVQKKSLLPGTQVSKEPINSSATEKIFFFHRFFKLHSQHLWHQRDEEQNRSSGRLKQCPEPEVGGKKKCPVNYILERVAYIFQLEKEGPALNFLYI